MLIFAYKYIFKVIGGLLGHWTLKSSPKEEFLFRILAGWARQVTFVRLAIFVTYFFFLLQLQRNPDNEKKNNWS